MDSSTILINFETGEIVNGNTNDERYRHVSPSLALKVATRRKNLQSVELLYPKAPFSDDILSRMIDYSEFEDLK